MTAVFTKATRSASKFKLSIQGPSGSGKTLGALALAKALSSGRFAVIDTENGSASLYADRFDFDTLQIGAPYLSRKYHEAVAAAIQADYPLIVIDSLSHQWDGDGGILQRKTALDSRGGNSWTNWKEFTEEHNKFVAMILQSPVHIISTMRSKMAYSQNEDGGKKKIQKLGLQPIQRDGMEYEFTMTFDVQMDHKATVSKNRTGLFDEGLIDLLDPVIPHQLLGWLSSAGFPEPATPGPGPHGTTDGPTEKQVTFFGKLLLSHVWTEEERQAYRESVIGASGEGVSHLIDEVVKEGKRRKALEKELESAGTATEGGAE